MAASGRGSDSGSALGPGMRQGQGPGAGKRRGCSFLASPSATLETLDRWGLRTKKSLGQHFLVDDGTIARICDLAEIREGETILEIGPGIGVLTVALLGLGARAVCVELDGELIPAVIENASEAAFGDAGMFRILNMDALDLGWGDLEEACVEMGAPLPAKLVANLPYSVAATVVLKILQEMPAIETLCVMVQSEVADRMRARPGSKDYGAYSVKLGLFAHASGSFDVGRGSFLPPPRVGSTVIRLDRRPVSDDPDLLEAATMMSDAAFFQRRKTIRNSMSAFMSSRGIDGSCVDDILADAGIDSSRRGETLSQDEFFRLGRACLYNPHSGKWR